MSTAIQQHLNSILDENFSKTSTDLRKDLMESLEDEFENIRAFSSGNVSETFNVYLYTEQYKAFASNIFLEFFKKSNYNNFFKKSNYKLISKKNKTSGLDRATPAPNLVTLLLNKVYLKPEIVNIPESFSVTELNDRKTSMNKSNQQFLFKKGGIVDSETKYFSYAILTLLKLVQDKMNDSKTVINYAEYYKKQLSFKGFDANKALLYIKTLSNPAYIKQFKIICLHWNAKTGSSFKKFFNKTNTYYTKFAELIRDEVKGWYMKIEKFQSYYNQIETTILAGNNLTSEQYELVKNAAVIEFNTYTQRLVKFGKNIRYKTSRYAKKTLAGLGGFVAMLFVGLLFAMCNPIVAGAGLTLFVIAGVAAFAKSTQ